MSGVAQMLSSRRKTIPCASALTFENKMPSQDLTLTLCHASMIFWSGSAKPNTSHLGSLQRVLASSPRGGVQTLHGIPDPTGAISFHRFTVRVAWGTRNVLTSEEWSAAYLDDVVIYSTTWEDHLLHLGKTIFCTLKRP